MNFQPNEIKTPLADASPLPERFSVLELSTAEYGRLTPYIRLLMDVPETHHRESHIEMLLWAFLFELSHLRNDHQPEASVSYFIHCFSAAVGCTPHKYAAQIHARDAVIRDEYPKT